LGLLHPYSSYGARPEDRNPHEQATSPQKGWPKADISFLNNFQHGFLLLLLLLTSSYGFLKLTDSWGQLGMMLSPVKLELRSCGVDYSPLRNFLTQ
jgi:hypothetical protein